jgi:hypothetical protein
MAATERSRGRRCFRSSSQPAERAMSPTATELTSLRLEIIGAVSSPAALGPHARPQRR